MSGRGPDEWFHAAPDDLAKIVVGSGSYKHAAPTELGGPCGSCGYKHAAPTELVGFRRHRCYKHAARDGAVGGGPSAIAP